jgi:site-specific DNA recombinase
LSKDRRRKATQRITDNDYVAYLRVSTKDQVKTDFNPEGISIPAQREKVHERGQDIGSAKVAEFIDPGRSAVTIDKRPEFQAMIAYIREHPNVRYVIVYMLSRFARNRLDDALMVATLEKLGVKLISAVEKNIDDTPTGRMLHGVIAVINEYNSDQNGEDIYLKMLQKVKSGGTVSRAPVGYLTVAERIDDREFRTVIIDPVRGPLIRQAFELYATGDYTLADLSDELYERGLRMPRYGRHPTERQISVNKLSVMLKDEYYIGWVKWDGERHKGRHEALIEGDLFDRVQDIASSRTQAQELRRIHHHYLKGSLACGSCWRRHGERRRMVIQNATNRFGSVYRYFFCMGRYGHTCELPYVPIGRVEEAVEAHYATIRFSPAFITMMETGLAATLEEQQSAGIQLRQQLTKQLRELDTKETNLIDLAADGTLPQAKIRERLHEITRQRERLQSRLTDTNEELVITAEVIRLCLELLENPEEIYRRCDDQQRRMLNQALFETLYIHEEVDGELRVTSQLKEPFAVLHEVQEQLALAVQAEASPGTETSERAQQGPSGQATYKSSALPQVGEGAAWNQALAALVGGSYEVSCSNGTSVVRRQGLEPRTR